MSTISTIGNARSDFVRGAVLAAMLNDNWKPLLATVRDSDTWPFMVSPSTAIRDSLQWSGFRSLEFVLLQLSSERHSGLLPNNYETVKECLMNKHVLTEIVKQYKLRNAKPIVPEGSSAKDAFLVFVGGMRRDCGDLKKTSAWLRNLFTPLMHVAENAFKSFEARSKAAIGNTEANHPRKCARETDILGRLRMLQSARDFGKDAQPGSLIPSQHLLAQPSLNGASSFRTSSSGMDSSLLEPLAYKPQQHPAFRPRADRLSLDPSRSPLTPRNHEAPGHLAASSQTRRPLLSAKSPTRWRKARNNENVHPYCG
ncbi:hypothetical protein R3P38DRAFT_2819813 [Favolaschia claudopus]|uniref:Uncharacterized protein n=1 Tax=Favolaschia claudopus TaxID=2862362 RepID=A0AAW0EH42_9AGAR